MEVTMKKGALTFLVKIRETNQKRTSVKQNSRSKKVVFLTRWRSVRIILIHLRSKNLKWDVLFLPSRTNAISQVYPGRQPDKLNKFYHFSFQILDMWRWRQDIHFGGRSNGWRANAGNSSALSLLEKKVEETGGFLHVKIFIKKINRTF